MTYLRELQLILQDCRSKKTPIIIKTITSSNLNKIVFSNEKTLILEDKLSFNVIEYTDFCVIHFNFPFEEKKK